MSGLAGLKFVVGSSWLCTWEVGAACHHGCWIALRVTTSLLVSLRVLSESVPACPLQYVLPGWPGKNADLHVECL